MKSLDPHRLLAWQAAEQLADRSLTAVELARACLDQVAARDAEVHAFASIDPDAVMSQARALDAGPIRGPLHGLPLGVKDLFDTADLPTTYGSPIYAGHRPVTDAASVALCRAAGALVLGKTVTTEFAYFQPGPTRNPRHLDHTPGGSSSGSAAAVADHMVPLALGTQTAGSVVRPAAYCGVVGFKPSHGRISRAGVKSLSETLDTVGMLGRCVRDVGLLAAVLTGDARLTARHAVPAPRIGAYRTPEWPQADGDTQHLLAQVITVLAPWAARLTDVDMPVHAPDLVALQKAVMSFEMSRAFTPERLQHAERFSERFRSLMDEGLQINGAQHAGHLAATALEHQRVDALFNHVDVLLAPSATGEAPAGVNATGDPLFCRSWTLLGLPCIHLPLATGSHGLPIGLQLVGRFGQDHYLLAVADALHTHWQGQVGSA